MIYDAMKNRVFILCLVCIFTVTIFYGGLTMYANNASLSMAKSDFYAGEIIKINYTGTSKKDWIGIYKKGGVPGSGNPSIVWEYTSKTGQPDGTMEFEGNLAEGSYDAVLCADDGYNELFRLSFNVLALNAAPQKPSGASYNLTGGKGEASGVISITPAEDEYYITKYVVYWGNGNNKLDEYTPLVTLNKTGKTIEYSIADNVIIPEGANSILVYSKNSKSESEDFVRVDIPQKFLPAGYGEPLYKFEVISDTHVRTESSHVHNKNLDNALKQIRELAPDSLGIMHAGDITDTGLPNEYNEFKRIWDENKDGLPDIYFAVGNHDLYTGKISDATSRFIDFSKSEKVYHDYWIKDYHFIFLGSEKGGHEYLNADLSAEQLSWLETKLSEKSSKDKPIFVFIHQPLLNTVAGSYLNQKWYGVNQDKELREILSKYPQVILFTGHTHWEFDSKNNMYDGKGSAFTAFNTASVGYLWTDADTYKAGSQGYFVEIYSDKILVRGRDFANSKWVPNAQFKVDLMTDAMKNNPKKGGLGLFIGLSLLVASLGAFVVFKLRNKMRHG